MSLNLSDFETVDDFTVLRRPCTISYHMVRSHGRFLNFEIPLSEVNSNCFFFISGKSFGSHFNFSLF